MSVFAFANPKGGTGKTTAALLLAEQIARAGARLAVLDVDPNQNLVDWKARRDAEGRATPFEVVGRPGEDDAIDLLDQLAEANDYVIVDLEGTASQIVTMVLTRTDLAIIPLEPTPMETRQAARAINLVRRTAKMISRPIPHTLVFTRTNAAFQTSDERDVRAETETSGVGLLPVSLVRRAAYTRIFREASLLSELKGKSVSNLDGAVANAREYAQAVVRLLDMAESEAA